jgi:hypothetical protein
MIARTRRMHAFRDVLDEARRFLSLPHDPSASSRASTPPARTGLREAARRLFHSAKPVRGTIAETYLRKRGISDAHAIFALRCHSRCLHRAQSGAPAEAWPALIAAVTDLRGTITGVLRTWLARDGSDKAPLATPRRAMGRLAGHGVRFGSPTDVIAAGEGLETMLSLRAALPAMPMVAALSASHLGTLILPPGLRRLYIACDNDTAGRHAAEELAARAKRHGIATLVLMPHADDFNTDLCSLGRAAIAASLQGQLAAEDAARFLSIEQPRSLPSGPASSLPAPGLPEGDLARSE